MTCAPPQSIHSATVGLSFWTDHDNHTLCTAVRPVEWKRKSGPQNYNSMNVLRLNHSKIGSGSSHWPTATCPVTKPRCSLSTNSTCHTAAPSMAVSHMGRPNLVRAAAAAGAVSLPATEEIYKGVYESPIFEGYWTWQGHRIRYHVSGAEGGEAVLLVHGFGGNADHWRKVRGLICSQMRGLVCSQISL